ncbi:THO complex subunit 1 [Homalodisca vitripennis]|nr:THO complex subunit 1 [Homalodisca vitripennis]
MSKIGLAVWVHAHDEQPGRLGACSNKIIGTFRGPNAEKRELCVLQGRSQQGNPKGVVNDGNFGWRALRLLALQSSHFFTHSNNPINKLPEYLEAMIKKIAKERPIMLPSGEKQEPLDVAESNTVLVNETEAMAEEDDELLKSDEKRDEMGSEEQPETPEASQNAPGIAAHIMDAVAKNIDAQWRELAEKMGFTDTIQYIEGSLQSDLERARYVVQLWAEDDLDNSAEQLAKSLEAHGFPKAAAVVKQSL